MGAGAHIECDVQPVASSDAAGRMQQHGVADVGAFGVQGLLHAQGPLVAGPGEHGPLPCTVFHAQVERRLPAARGGIGIPRRPGPRGVRTGRQRHGLGQRHGCHQTVTISRTPWAAMSAPSPLATTLPRLITT